MPHWGGATRKTLLVVLLAGVVALPANAQARTYGVNDVDYRPPEVGQQRFLELAIDAGSRWGQAFGGRASDDPAAHYDAVDTVGFSIGLDYGTLGRATERHKRRCWRHRHRGGRRHRHCRWRLAEFDIEVNAFIRWQQGPAYPSGEEHDLETLLLHEFGHYAGEDRHALGCEEGPMWEDTAPGEWWRGPNDWRRFGCAGSARRDYSRARSLHFDHRVIRDR